MAFQEIQYEKKYIGTAAELAAMTVAEKLKITPGSTYWSYDTKAESVFAAGDWRAKV